MNDIITIRKATLNDIEFLVDTIVSAEKSGTDNFGLAKLFDLSENAMRDYIKAMLEEEIEGCEFSVSSFIVAETQGEVVAAFAGWNEGNNEDDMASAILKSNLVGYCLPKENVRKSQSKSDIVRPLQIEREKGSYQLEYSYTKPEYRGRGIMTEIIKAHIQQAVVDGCKKMQVHVFYNNPAAIKTYEKMGFEVTKKYESEHPLTSEYFPSNIELLMEKKLNNIYYEQNRN